MSFKKSSIICFLLLLQAFFLQGQLVVPYSAKQIEQQQHNFRQHIQILASDSLGGRETGTRYEQMAADYIAGEFSNAGIPPMKGQPYLLPFSFSEGCSYMSGELVFRDKRFEMNTHYFFLNKMVGYQFGGKTFFARNGLKPENYFGLDSASNKGVVIVVDVNFRDTCVNLNPCTHYFDMVQEAVLQASGMRPAAIILASSDFKHFPVYSDWNIRTMPPTVPVLGAGQKLSEWLLSGVIDTLISNNVYERHEMTGYNVVAVMDHGKPTTIVLGAHYDHLGLGGYSSRYNGPGQVHNGADDNASGVAMLIEIARKIKEQKYKNHNFLFIAFSGEEKGLLGSKAFLNQSYSGEFNMLTMLNFDMVGRADTAHPFINIIGTGTALEWDSLLNMASAGSAISISRSPSGLGGSDQMSFYNKKIPVLFFFTGMHSDYHKPSDDVEKINFKAMSDVMFLSENIIATLNDVDSLHFMPTESQDGARKRPGVTLGLIPDHAWTGKGLRIDGVTTGKTAEKSGLKAGDIIIAIGEKEISDIMTYMEVLGTYKKGDQAKITYLRGQIESCVEVIF